MENMYTDVRVERIKSYILIVEYGFLGFYRNVTSKKRVLENEVG